MFICPKAYFNRPANGTAYAQNELVGNDEDAADVVPLTWDVSKLSQGCGRINAVRIFTDDETVTAANFNLHLFSILPVPTNGDNGAFAVSTARGFLGTVAMDMTTGAFVTTTDKAKRFAITGGIGFQSPIKQNDNGASGNFLYGLLETATGAAYDPDGAELFEVALEIEG